MDTILLAKLRDVHLPATVNMWPPAIGWIILSMLFIFVLFLLGKKFHADWQKYSFHKKIHERLSSLELAFVNQPTTQARVMSELSYLLKQFAMHYYPERNPAGLHSNAWLAFLDETGNTHEFTEGSGQLLTSAPYAKYPSEKARELFPLIRQWLGRHIC